MSDRELIDPMIPIDQPKKALVNPMIFDARTKSPEEKIFIILYLTEEDEVDDEHRHIYSVCYGRTEAYNNIKNKLISGLNIDIHRSIVITETKQTETSTGDKKYYMVPFDECLTVYSFCNQVSGFYSDDEFEIEDYDTTDIPEDKEAEFKEEHPMFLTAEEQSYENMMLVMMQEKSGVTDMRDMDNADIHNI